MSGGLLRAAGTVLPLGVVGLLGGSQKKAQTPAVLPPSRDMAAELAARRADELRRRRGAGANELTGGGAEPVTPGAKTLLGQ
jgi:hypothetical protein